MIGGDEREGDIVSSCDESSHLAASAASLMRCIAIISSRKVDLGLGLEFLEQLLHDSRVEILPTEEGIARGRLDLEDAVADLEHRDIKGPTAEVVDGDPARRTRPCRSRRRAPPRSAR